MTLLPRRTYPLVLLAVLLAGCAGIGPSSSLQPPAVSLNDITVRSASMFEQRYGLKLRVQNPNAEPMPIEGLAFRVRLNNVEFGQGVARKSVTVPAYGESFVDVDLVSSAWQLLQRVRDVAAGTGKGFTIAIDGDVSLARSTATLPFSYKGQIGNSNVEDSTEGRTQSRLD